MIYSSHRVKNLWPQNKPQEVISRETSQTCWIMTPHILLSSRPYRKRVYISSLLIKSKSWKTIILVWSSSSRRTRQSPWSRSRPHQAPQGCLPAHQRWGEPTARGWGLGVFLLWCNPSPPCHRSCEVDFGNGSFCTRWYSRDVIDFKEKIKKNR